MATQEEEIVIIEDSDAAAEETQTQEQPQEEEEERKKLLLFGGIAIIVVLILTIAAILIIWKVKKKEKSNLSTQHIQTQLTKKQKKVIQPSKLEHLIAKANYLYTTGQKEEALKLYEYIAQYSEAISQYNLGVAKLKNKQYKEALTNFNIALENGEKRCVSAINAAVCSLYLNDNENFKYYIDLAEAYLPNEINSPLYPYYYALIQFYHKNYYEALTSLEYITQPEYRTTKDLLKSKLAALFQSNYDAIEALEDIKEHNIPFNKALLYANIGDLSLAKENFSEAVLKGFHPQKAVLGLIYTQIKSGEIKSAVAELKSANKRYGDNLLDPYPIKVHINKALFNPLKAQTKFRQKFYNDEALTFEMLFYFSPYKIFNANQTINYIRKGNATSYIDSVESAKEFLTKSASTSNVNKGIAQAIKLALHFQIREANKLLEKLVTIQPKHSILHYNLALTYAQLGDMQNAHKHFLWSYHLDAKHYLAGIYAYMTSKLIHKEDKKLLAILKESLLMENAGEKYEFHKTLLQVAQGHYLAAVDWLDNNYKTRPIYLILDTILGIHLRKQEAAQKSAEALKNLLPQEIVPHIIFINTKLLNAKKPYYAKEIANYMKTQHFSYQDLFYGANITRYMYIQEHLITGELYKLVQLLKEKLSKTTKKDTVDMELALAQTLFYNQNFEESYVLYNHLIDEVKVQDPQTLFLASVAAIEAKHHENAIALLELSKLKDRKYLETRYALALLYFEINNARGARIELENMPTYNFHSDYFTFDIDLEKLTFQHQQKKKD
ncbi:MAG: tetratricopeptide repeat protein [Epsilonproteobacteria bacterium]|nr:tetratricopeptide repeat protein [Campylobacterota bacterium]